MDKKVVLAIVLVAMLGLASATVYAYDLSEVIAPGVEEEPATIRIIQEEIKENGLNWIAGKTSVSELSVDDKLKLCGAKVGPIPEDAIEITPPMDVNLSVGTGTFDWRSVNGTNWMTSVKDQGPCGSCWIFGSTGAFEAQINIDAHDPTIDFDSSEQNILSCSGGGSCDGGDPVMALIYIRDNGVPDEACLTYRADDTIPCSVTCPDWEYRAWTFEWIGVPAYHTTENYKYILENYGPMVVVLNVSEDLFYYRGGIYEPVWTSEEFGQADHCVTLVGYNDSGRYWIIKNSWGSGWGEEGYGAVRYGGLEQYKYAFVIVNTSGPAPAPTISISTDKTSYKPGDNMLVSLNVTNPGDARAVGIHIGVKKPDGRTVWFINKPSVTLSAGLEYSKEKVITLPSIPVGTYTWRAILADPATGKIICEDTAPWEFVLAGKPTEDIARVLERATIDIDFGDIASQAGEIKKGIE
jgi:C1A family cysteine protease